jgi:hypothetical protein
MAMKKIRIVGFVVFAMCAFSAIVASAASAGEWLVEGVSLAVGTTVSSETEGELELKVYAGAPPSLVLTAILCSGIFDGTMTWPNLDLVTDVLTLDSLTTIGELAMENTTALSCEVIFDDGEITACKVGTLAEVTVDNLNLELGLAWETELLLPAAGEWIDHFPAVSGYDVRCESLLGVFGENLCEGAVHALMSNDVTTVPASILGEFMTLTGEAGELERANCTLTGEHTGEVVGTGHTWVIEGELVHLETAVS